MGDNLVNWVARNGLLPHGYCFQWNGDLVLLMVLSDLLIALAYYSIPVALLVLLDKRKDIIASWVFMLFCAFIFLCGTTHLVDIAVIWYPLYWLQGWVKAATAIASVATAIAIWPFILRLPRVAVIPKDRAVEKALTNKE
jgi:hypothetical protein